MGGLLSIAGVLAALLPAAALAGGQWWPVPGAGEIEVDLRAVEQERGVVIAWVRYPGSEPIARGWTPAPTGRPRGVHRTVLHTEFDCHKRTMRTLAAQATNSSGAPIFMSSVPGPLMPVPDVDAMAWVYDAVCELGGRGQQRRL